MKISTELGDSKKMHKKVGTKSRADTAFQSFYLPVEAFSDEKLHNSLIESKYLSSLLAAYGWPQASFVFQDDLAAHKQKKVSAKYWYPFGEVTAKTLQEDAHFYAHNFPKSTGARRVCFFVAKKNHPRLVLLLSFSSWEKVNAAILGDKSHSFQIMAQLAIVVQQVFRQATVKLQPLGKQNPDLILSAWICQWLRQAYFEMKVDLQTIYKEHSQQCQRWFLERIAQYEQHSPINYRSVKASLQIIAKYQQLLATRISIIKLSHLNSADDVDKVLQFDQYRKKLIYSQTLSIDTCLSFWTLNNMLRLLACNDIASIEQQLKTYCEKGFEEILRWEQALSQRQSMLLSSWSAYLYQITIRSIRAIYKYSFVGFGAEILDSVSKILLNRLQSIGLKVAYLPTALQFSSNQFHIGAKIAGGLLGAAGTYMSDWSGIMRVALIPGLGMLLKNVFDKLSIDDRNALTSRIIPGQLGAIRIASLMMALFESYRAEQSPALVLSVGAIIGNISMTEFGKRIVLKREAKTNHVMTESETLLLVLFALSGQWMGKSMAHYAYLAVDKYMARSAVMEVICNTTNTGGKIGCIADFPVSYLRWHFWSTSNDTVCFRWTQKQRYIEGMCEVSKLSTSQRMMKCSASESAFLRLSTF